MKKWQYLSADGAWNDTADGTYKAMTFEQFKEKILLMGFLDVREI